MEQYSIPNESESTNTRPAPNKELKSIESQVSELEHRLLEQSNEISRLQRELARLKNTVDSVISHVKRNV